MNRINTKNIISPKVVRIVRIALGIILLINLVNRILYPWNNEIPALLYFTVLTNIFIAIYYIGASLFKKLLNSLTAHALTSYILIVGVVFVIFLDDGFLVKIYTKLSENTINQDVHYITMTNSMMTHYIMPIIVSVDYFVLTDMRKINIDIKILIFPVIYLVIVMAYGLSTGCYVYPFLDIKFLGGWVVLVIVVVALICIFVLTSFFLYKLNCKIQSTIENYYMNIMVK